VPTRSAVTLLTIGPKDEGERYSRPSSVHEIIKVAQKCWPLDGGQLSDYDSEFFTSAERIPGTLRRGGWVGLEAGLKFLEKCLIPTGHRTRDPPPCSMVATPTTLP